MTTRPGRLWWLALPLAPAQGLWLKRTMRRYADADGRAGQVGSGSRRLTVVALGDSVAAGYSLAHHRDSVAGQLAERVAAAYDATVEWRVAAKSGTTAGEALALVSASVLRGADLVFLSVGVNDLKNLHSAGRFRREFAALLDAVLAAAPGAQVCWLGIPPLDHFPAFPRPLADVLGWRGRRFDAIAAEAVGRRERAFRIQSDGPLGPEMFGPDGFHPSATLHAAFADAVMDALAEDGRGRALWGRPGRTVWFLTHPQVAVDPEVDVRAWGLNPVGRARAEALADAPFLDAVTGVWSSTETKAVDTAEALSGIRPVWRRERLGENDHSATGFMPPEEFERVADAFFAQPEASVRGWATAADEQRRIVAAVEEILAAPETGDGDVVIVAHGAVGTLLLCHLLGRPITRDLDQPGQGHVFAFDRDTRAVRHTWRPLESLLP